MKRKIIYSCILICLVLIIIGVYFGRNEKNSNKIPNKGNNNIGSNIDEKSSKKLNIQYIQDNLNKKNNNLKLIKDFSIGEMCYYPLYKIDTPYPYCLKSDTGEISALSRYTEGTYSIGDNLNIDVVISQDKTDENGGFIYYYNEKYTVATYKYKDSFLIFKINFDSKATNSEQNLGKFIQNFLIEYKKYYSLI